MTNIGYVNYVLVNLVNSMVKNKHGFYSNGAKKNKYLQKKNMYYIIDQKSLSKYKKYVSSQQDCSEDQSDVNSGVAISSRRHTIVKPDIQIVSKFDHDSESIKNEQSDLSGNDSNSKHEPLQLNGVKPKKSISKWNKTKIEYQRAEADRISEIKAIKTLKRKLRKTRIQTTKLLTQKTKKGQPVMKNVIKHLLFKLHS